MQARRWALVVFGLVGCVRTSAIRPSELARLDGYQAGPAIPDEQREIETLDGRALTVRSDNYVSLSLEKPDARMGGRFESITVRDGVFDGRTVDGRRVQIPVDQLTRAEVHQADLRPLGVAVAGTLLLLLAAGLIVHYTHPLETY